MHQASYSPNLRFSDDIVTIDSQNPTKWATKSEILMTTGVVIALSQSGQYVLKR